ncbi:MAG: hypothetical protein ACK6AD_13395 [Cyanobacteriota bacterium]|jgi:hypothetical protein
MTSTPSSELGQLTILNYQSYPSTAPPRCSHLLISSTGPLEAEISYRPELQPDNSKIFLINLRKDIDTYLQQVKDEKRRPNISLVIRIHGYNVPLKSIITREFPEASQKLARDCAAPGMASDDYILFVHYCWPSERIFSGGPIAWLRALPIFPLSLLVVAIAFSLLINQLAIASAVVLTFVLTLVLLRAVVYFRDRDRAASFGVFDGVEMIRALHQILIERLTQTWPEADLQALIANRFSLSFMAHSMGSFVTTQLVRVLSDVFEQEAQSHFWDGRPDGPFQAPSACSAPESRERVWPESQEPVWTEPDEASPSSAWIGELFVLKRLILASPDIPVWAITTGRSNYLASCLRRFQETYLFVNDADIVLRLASTLANYFVFASRTPVGGYRLGNLSLKERGISSKSSPRGGYGYLGVGAFSSLMVNGFHGSRSLQDQPFDCDPKKLYAFTVLDCTDYLDHAVSSGGAPRRKLSSFKATAHHLRLFNYIATVFQHLLGKCDSHGGYFNGVFCLDLIYSLAVNGRAKTLSKLPHGQQQLERVQIAWMDF